MEGHAGLQLEGVDQPVVADRIVGREALLNRALVGQREQRLVDVAVEGFVDALPGARGVVEVLRLVERSDFDDGGRLRQHGRAHRQHGHHRSGRNERASAELAASKPAGKIGFGHL